MPDGHDVGVTYILESYLGTDLRSNAVHHIQVTRFPVGWCAYGEDVVGGRTDLYGFVPDPFGWTPHSPWSRSGTVRGCGGSGLADIVVRVSLLESWSAS
jgi:hypothetical protein